LCNGKDKLHDFRFAEEEGHIELLKALIEIDPLSLEEIQTLQCHVEWFVPETTQTAVLEFLDNLLKDRQDQVIP
jgi:hypothetical protein